MALFLIGAFGYSIIELLWRGRTHWSMMLAGGISFFLFAIIEKRFSHLPRLYRCIFGSAAVTVIELIFGLIFNVYLRIGVWDYSKIPFNFMGQICVLYSVLWGFLCIPVMPLARKVYMLLIAHREFDGGQYEKFSEKDLGRN